jgi:hypothetical protein
MSDVEAEFFKKAQQQQATVAAAAPSAKTAPTTFHQPNFRGAYVRSWWIAFIICFICYVLGLMSRSPWFTAGLVFCLLVGLYHFAGYDEKEQHAGRGAIRGSIAAIIILPTMTLLAALCLGWYANYLMPKEPPSVPAAYDPELERLEEEVIKLDANWKSGLNSRTPYESLNAEQNLANARRRLEDYKRAHSR